MILRRPFLIAQVALSALTFAAVSSAEEPEVESVAPAKPEDLSAFVGRIISSVSVVVEGEPKAELRAPRVRAGDTFEVSPVRAAFHALLEGGAFARGQVLVSSDAAGVVVTFRMVPRKIIDAIELELGGATIDVDRLLAETGLRKDSEVIPQDFREKAAQLEQFFSNHGYPKAKATFKVRQTDDPLRVVLSVFVSPGPPLEVLSREFEFDGDSNAAVRALSSSYAIGPHARVELDLMDKADRQLAETLASHAYVRAKVTHRIEPSTSGVRLHVLVAPGPVFVPHFHGNRTFDAATLMAAIDIAGDTDRSPAHWADAIRRYYVQRAFFDVEVTPTMAAQAKASEQVVTFDIVEHERVHVGARHFPCLPVNEIARLSGDGPSSVRAINSEIDSYLEEELPGAELLARISRSGLHELTTGESRPRAEPLVLSPDVTFAPETLNRALAHVQDLYRSEGYVSATVGPLQALRRTCDPHFPGGRCVPLPVPEPSFSCNYDPSGLPTGATSTPAPASCVPNGDQVACDTAVDLYIPIELGPRTKLYDLAFAGVKSFAESRLAEIADVSLGSPVSSAKLDEARRRILDAYKDEGFAYADVSFAIEQSLNHTQARIRFDVSEGERVIVDAIEVRGAENIAEAIIRRRVVLKVGEPYRAGLVRRTQELLGMLGTFSSVTVSLDNPEVHDARKTVVIRVAESVQWIAPRIGVSTGEGVRAGLDYHNPNIGSAISLDIRAAVSYLPDGPPFLTPASPLWSVYGNLGTNERLPRRLTFSFGIPDIGLGPAWRTQVDAIHVQDLEPDFALTKFSVGGTLSYRPSKHILISFGADMETNSVYIFDGDTIQTYLQNNAGDTALSRLLRFPNGPSAAVAQRTVFAWDRRDNIFNPHTGTYLSLGAEIVGWQCLSYNECTQGFSDISTWGTFVRLTQTFSGYIPLGNKVTLAGSIRFGENVQLAHNSTTYPDREFFQGGSDTNRGWALDSIIPQDYRLQLGSAAGTAPTRGGNLMVNPRAELRFPLFGPFDGVFFVDTGNVWSDALFPFQGKDANGHVAPFSDRIALRTSVGTGVRFRTPIGPIALDFGFKTEAANSVEDGAAFQINFAIGLY